MSTNTTDTGASSRRRSKNRQLLRDATRLVFATARLTDEPCRPVYSSRESALANGCVDARFGTWVPENGDVKSAREGWLGLVIDGYYPLGGVTLPPGIHYQTGPRFGQQLAAARKGD